MVYSAIDSAKAERLKRETAENEHAKCASILQQAREEASKAVEDAQANQSAAEQAQRSAEEKLATAERLLSEERKKTEELGNQLEASKTAYENAIERKTKTILDLEKDLGQSRAALGTVTEDFKASAEYLTEKTLYFVGGFEKAKKAFQKKFPEADLQGIEPEPPSEGESTTEADQSGDDEDQDDAQS
jgi:chromosome segregation ATPase